MPYILFEQSMRVMMVFRIVLLSVLIFFSFKEVVSQELIEVNRVVPPIPTSQYKYPYVENDKGQIKQEIKVGLMKGRDYQLYLPNGASDKTRPAIILFHGAGRTGVSLVEKWKSVADEYNVILIGPSATGKRWDYENDGPGFIDAVLKDAQSKNAIDPSRLYMYGHSNGATHVLLMSVIYSDKIAASAIHAGMFADRANDKAIDRAKRKIPMLLVVGTEDAIFPVAKVGATAKAFSDRGHPVGFDILEGHNHWYYTLAPYINEAAWQFLSQYELN